MHVCLSASLPVFPLIRERAVQAVKAEAEFDSWLTVSVTEGNTHDYLSAIGIDFETWSVDFVILIIMQLCTWHANAAYCWWLSCSTCMTLIQQCAAICR